MKDVNSVATRTGPDGDDSNDMLDESTRQVLDEYSRKFLSFIQQEKDRIRKQAQEEAERLLSDSEKRGRLAYDKTVQEAKLESERVLARCNERASRLTDEAERLFQVILDLKERTLQDVEKLRSRLHDEGEAVAEALREGDAAISESKAALAKEFEASAEVVAQFVQNLKSPSGARQKGAGPTALPVPDTPGVKADAERPMSRTSGRDDSSTRKNSDKTFVGTLNFDIDKGSAALYRRFRESLAKVAGLEISMADDYSKDRAKIVAFASRPIALMSVLHQMSLVKSAVADKDTIEVTLQEADSWVG